MSFRLAVFTSGRQDWGALAGAARVVVPGIEALVIAGGMHARAGAPPLEPAPAAVIDSLPTGDVELDVAQAAARTTGLVAETLVQLRAEGLLLLGDRTETLAAALAATCLRLPVVHLHGGESSHGAIDDTCRHALSRLAHLHCVAHRVFAERLLAWGERRERVVVSGAPALDALLGAPLPDRNELQSALGRSLGQPLVLLTHHPSTLGATPPEEEMEELLAGLSMALRAHPAALVVCTRPNVDSGGARVAEALGRWCAAEPRALLVSDLGARLWWGLMAHAHALVGNSSSGIIEAPCFDLPVLNLGERQAGRPRAGPVLDITAERGQISAALAPLLLAPRAPVAPHPSAWGDGRAWPRIMEAVRSLVAWAPMDRLRKHPLTPLPARIEGA